MSLLLIKMKGEKILEHQKKSVLLLIKYFTIIYCLVGHIDDFSHLFVILGVLLMRKIPKHIIRKRGIS